MLDKLCVLSYRKAEYEVAVPLLFIVISFIVLDDGRFVHAVGSVVEYTLTKLVEEENEI